jgi:hypothetical protein
MRYFLVKYSRKPTGQMDETISVSKRLRTKDYQTSAVILDFQSRQVIQASMDGVTVPRDWNRIRDFYHQHYAKLIEDLEAIYPVITDKDPVSM